MKDPTNNDVKMAPMAGMTGMGGGAVTSYQYLNLASDSDNWITVTSNDTYSLSQGQIGVNSTTQTSSNIIWQRTNYTRTVTTTQVRLYTGFGTYVGGTEVYNASGTGANSEYRRQANWIETSDGGATYGSGPYDNSQWGLYKWSGASGSCPKKTNGQPSGSVNGKVTAVTPNGEVFCLGYDGQIKALDNSLNTSWQMHYTVNNYFHMYTVDATGESESDLKCSVMGYTLYSHNTGNKLQPVALGYNSNGSINYSKKFTTWTNQGLSALISMSCRTGKSSNAIVYGGSVPNTSPTGAWLTVFQNVDGSSPSIKWDKNVRMFVSSGNSTSMRGVTCDDLGSTTPNIYCCTKTTVSSVGYIGVHKFAWDGSHEWTTKLSHPTWDLQVGGMQCNKATGEIYIGGTLYNGSASPTTKAWLVRLEPDGSGQGTSDTITDTGAGITYSTESDYDISNISMSISNISGSNQGGSGSFQNASTPTRGVGGTMSHDYDFF